MKKINVGIFLARMQPLHNAHLHILKRACKENDKVIVMLGSSNKRDILRNPFDLDTRKFLLKEALLSELNAKEALKVEVYEIPDWSYEGDTQEAKEWGRYFYYNVVSRAKTKTFNIYYSDNPQIMLNWFDDNLQERINFVFMKRESMFDGLSATKIREAFSNDDFKYIKQYCPAVILEHYDRLKRRWFKVKNNPKNDFSMK